MQFFPAPFRAPLRAFAALVFPWVDDKVLICNIADRGWCIPSGRVEPMEESLETVCREAREEGGAVLDHVQYIGCYQICERREVRWADCYVSGIREMREIEFKTESLGVDFVTMEQLPEIYHNWNDLTHQVFEHSYEVVSRHRNGFLP